MKQLKTGQSYLRGAIKGKKRPARRKPDQLKAYQRALLLKQYNALPFGSGRRMDRALLSFLAAKWGVACSFIMRLVRSKGRVSN